MNKDDAEELMRKFKQETSRDDIKERDMLVMLSRELKTLADPLGQMMVMMIHGDRELRGKAQPLMPILIGTVLSAYIMRGANNMDEAITLARSLSDEIVNRVTQCDMVLNKDETKK